MMRMNPYKNLSGGSSKRTKAYGDFRGGWNTDAAPDTLTDHELALADNVDLDERGAINKRRGFVPVNASSYNGEVEQIIEWSRNDGSTILLAVISTTLVKIEDDGTRTDIQELASNSIGYFIFQDNFYFVDGDNYYIYNGTTVSIVTPKAVGDNNLVPIRRCTSLVFHPKSFRVFATGDSQDKAALYYCEPNEPNYFKTTSKLYPTTGDGPTTGLGLFGGSLLTLYRNTIWAWKGSDPATDAVWEKLPANQGTVTGKTVSLTPNSLTFLGIGGIYRMSPALLDYNIILFTSGELMKNLAKDKVTSVIRAMEHPATACALFDKYTGKYLLAYGDDPENPRNNKVLVYDWELKAFTRYTNLQVNCFCQRVNGDLLIGTRDFILKLAPVYRDWSPEVNSYVPIKLHVKSKPYNLDYPFNEKKFFKFFLAARQYEGVYSTIDLRVIYDYKEHELLDVLLDESFAWGDHYGMVWGWVDLISRQAKLKGQAHRGQLDIVNAKLDERLTIYGFAFQYKLRRAKGGKMHG